MKFLIEFKVFSKVNERVIYSYYRQINDFDIENVNAPIFDGEAIGNIKIMSGNKINNLSFHEMRILILHVISNKIKTSYKNKQQGYYDPVTELFKYRQYFIEDFKDGFSTLGISS